MAADRTARLMLAVELNARSLFSMNSHVLTVHVYELARLKTASKICGM